MSKFITYALLSFMFLYVLILVVDLVANRELRRVAIQAVLLAAVIGLLNVTTGFPHWKQAFGGPRPLLAISVMLICVILGMFAHYLFFLGRKKFRWYPFLRPLVISPIVVLPLLGTVELKQELTDLQLISFAFLAFQNGFFWKAVFERAQPEI